PRTGAGGLELAGRAARLERAPARPGPGGRCAPGAGAPHGRHGAADRHPAARVAAGLRARGSAEAETGRPTGLARQAEAEAEAGAPAAPARLAAEATADRGHAGTRDRAAPAAAAGRARRARARPRGAHRRLRGGPRLLLEPPLMRTAALLATLALALVAARTAGAAGPVVSYTITSGTTGDNGWYRSAVTAQLAVQGATDSDCPLVKTFKSSADALSCSATDGTSTVQFHLQCKIDTDAPTVTSATPDRAPDGGGWYSHPVTVAFAGTDPTSGIAGCTSATYSGPDSGSASVAGSCRDNAGNVGTTTTTIRYDATPPAVTATPSRKADANGWYSHAVGVSFAGTDAGSGIGSCTAPLSYSGPDTAQATVTGGCVDAAGNRGTASVTFRYDTTAPKLANVAVAVASRSATLTWREPADTASVTITRRPGRNGRRASVVYRGRA